MKALLKFTVAAALFSTLAFGFVQYQRSFPAECNAVGHACPCFAGDVGPLGTCIDENGRCHEIRLSCNGRICWDPAFNC